MDQKGIAPILIIVLITLGLGGYLYYQKHPTNISAKVTNLQPTPTPTDKPATVRNIPSFFEFRKRWNMQIGPRHYASVPAEVSNIPDSELIGLSCDPDNFKCYTENNMIMTTQINNKVLDTYLYDSNDKIVSAIKGWNVNDPDCTRNNRLKAFIPILLRKLNGNSDNGYQAYFVCTYNFHIYKIDFSNSTATLISSN